jgi:serine/threonine-protein kinase HipA
LNILVGNTDDHARNHAAFWDGQMLTLTPAYDICPQGRNTGRATQAMTIGDATDRFKESQVASCVERAHLYQLTKKEATAIVDHQIDVIRNDWAEVCEQAELTETGRGYFWKRQFLNDYALEGWPPATTTKASSGGASSRVRKGSRFESGAWL